MRRLDDDAGDHGGLHDDVLRLRRQLDMELLPGLSPASTGATTICPDGVWNCTIWPGETPAGNRTCIMASEPGRRAGQGLCQRGSRVAATGVRTESSLWAASSPCASFLGALKTQICRSGCGFGFG